MTYASVFGALPPNCRLSFSSFTCACITESNFSRMCVCVVDPPPPPPRRHDQKKTHLYHSNYDDRSFMFVMSFALFFNVRVYKQQIKLIASEVITPINRRFFFLYVSYYIFFFKIAYYNVRRLFIYLFDLGNFWPWRKKIHLMYGRK